MGKRNQPTGERYEIRTVADFLLVPESKRALCLREFGTWLKVHDPLVALLGGPDVVKMRPVYTWIDDGKREMSITLHAKGGEAK
jgi:hypothetical protein